MRDDLAGYDEKLGPALDGDRARCCFTPEVTRGIGSAERRRTVAVGMALLIVLGCSLLVLGIEGRRSRPHSRICMGLAIGFFAAFGAVVIGFLFGEIRGWSSVQVLQVLPAVFLRKLAGGLPMGEPGLWGLVAVIFVVCYLIAERSFLRAEFGLRKVPRVYEEY
jgi:hypothetical protein